MEVAPEERPLPKQENRSPVIQGRIQFAILLISAVGIAYQVVLMRVFSIAQWHHFAYMIISIAMLGFGASGTVLALLRSRVRGHEPRLLAAASLLLAVTVVACYALSQRVPFETFELVSQPRQLARLLALYVILAAPFFLCSTCITLGFFLMPRRIGRLYFYNMLGSGLGAAGVVGLLYIAHPSALVYALALAAALAHLVLLGPQRRCISSGAVVLAFVGLAAFRPLEAPRVSMYKGLSYALQAPDAEIVAERYSPMSVLTALRSDQIRETPGQISNYPMSQLGELPAQIGLYFDAGAVSPVSHFADGDLDRFAYLDYVTSALAYRLVERPRALVIGAGGGTDVLGALSHGADHVTAVEVDPSVVAVMRNEFREFSGGLYERPDVRPVLAEGRGFLRASKERFDLIQLPLFGSFNAASAGIHALNESYLYTVDAFILYLERLTERGVLAINCWLKTPARDAIKLFATAAQACERLGVTDPSRHLAFIRSWNNATIVVTRAPMTPAQVAAVRAFCVERGLDLCYGPGVEQHDANRYTVLESPVYFDAAQAILSADRDAFYRRYPFHVRPATDDCPYFFRYFKWAALPRLLRSMGTQWVPFVEWGYLTLLATLLQAIVVSTVLILLPLALGGMKNPKSKTQNPKSPLWLTLYFAALGAAYLSLEMAFIQRFMLFLAYPVYAVAVVLTAFLLFSGLGSLCSDRLPGSPARRVAAAVAGIALSGGMLLAGLGPIFDAGAAWPDIVRIAVGLMLLAPLAFCMGIPFPTGFQLVSDRAERLVPWAWGINGCASVVGATFATFTAVHLGFRVVVLLALGTYGIAALAIIPLWKGLPTPEPTKGT